MSTTASSRSKSNLKILFPDRSAVLNISILENVASFSNEAHQISRKTTTQVMDLDHNRTTINRINGKTVIGMLPGKVFIEDHILLLLLRQ